jgi:hypothetical protein
MTEFYYIVRREDAQGNQVDQTFLCEQAATVPSPTELLDRATVALAREPGYDPGLFNQPLTMRIHGPFVCDGGNTVATRKETFKPVRYTG